MNILKILKIITKLLLRRGINNSFSQFGEDAIIQNIFQGTSGTYVDVGAYHPVLYSNTYALYRKGWSGIVIDPNFSMESLFRFFRSRDKFICSAIGIGGFEKYYSFNDGAYNTLNKKESEIRKKLPWLKFMGEKSIKSIQLSVILEQNNITKIDFLNIDVEGMDLIVLESHNWSIRPTIIAVEDDKFNLKNLGESDIYNFLCNKNYELIAYAGLTFIWATKA